MKTIIDYLLRLLAYLCLFYISVYRCGLIAGRIVISDIFTPPSRGKDPRGPPFGRRHPPGGPQSLLFFKCFKMFLNVSLKPPPPTPNSISYK